MKVEMDLLPGKQPQPVRRLWLEIPLKDKEAPLFHYCAMDGMRRNYAGKTPRGGRIVWGPQATQGWLPPLWKAEPGGDDGLLWTCRDIRPNQANVIPTDFVPYIWLGGGERAGLLRRQRQGIHPRSQGPSADHRAPRGSALPARRAGQ